MTRPIRRLDSAPARTRASTLRRASGFSLVEITLALGIIAFALLAVFGLLPVSAQANADSKADTVSASISEQVVSELRSRDFKAITASGNLSFYFTDDGSRVYAGTDVAAASEGALYECAVTLTNAPSDSAHLRYAILRISRPVTVSDGSRTFSRNMTASIANHGLAF